MRYNVDEDLRRMTSSTRRTKDCSRGKTIPKQSWLLTFWNKTQQQRSQEVEVKGWGAWNEDFQVRSESAVGILRTILNYEPSVEYALYAILIVRNEQLFVIVTKTTDQGHTMEHTRRFLFELVRFSKGGTLGKPRGSKGTTTDMDATRVIRKSTYLRLDYGQHRRRLESQAGSLFHLLLSFQCLKRKGKGAYCRLLPWMT